MELGFFKGIKQVVNVFSRMNKCRNLICILFVVIATGCSCMGQDYFVNPVNGNDSNPGTAALPWRSFLRATPTYSASPVVAQGDTVYLAPGNYGTVDYNRSENAGRTQWITYKASDAANEDNWPVFTNFRIRGITNCYFRFENIKVFSTVPGGVSMQIGHPTSSPRTSHIEMLNCYFNREYTLTGGMNYTIYMHNNDHVTIKDSEIDEGRMGVVTLNCTYMTIDGCEIHHIWEDAIHVVGGSSGSTQNVIQNNIIHHLWWMPATGSGHMDFFQTLPGAPRGLEVIFRNNIEDSSGAIGSQRSGQGIQMGANTGNTYTNVLIENNLLKGEFYGNLLAINYEADNLTIRNNTFAGTCTIQATSYFGTNAGYVIPSSDHYNNIWRYKVLPGSEIIDFQQDWNIYADGMYNGYQPRGANSQFVSLSNWDSLFTNTDTYELNTSNSVVAAMIAAGQRPGCNLTASDIDSPPVANAGTDQSITDTNKDGFEQVTFDASASNDPDDDITAYQWSNQGSPLATGVNPTVTLPVGHHEITLTVTDAADLTATDTVNINITVDNTPPSIISAAATLNNIEIIFSEAIEKTIAENILNYSANNNIQINSATLNPDGKTMILATSNHNGSLTYTLTVTNITDTSENTMTTATLDYTYNEGLIGFWDFRQSAETVVEDHSGNDNDATLLNGTTITEQDNLFFSNDDDGLEIPIEDLQPNSGSATLIAYPQLFSDSQYLLGHTIDTWSNRIQLYMNNGSLCLGLGDTHSKHLDIQTLELNNWYHIALTWDGNNYVVYINGEIKATGTYTGLTNLSSFADIGNDGNVSYRDEGFNGLIDNVRLYSKNLTNDEVLNVYYNDYPFNFSPVGDKTVDECEILSFDFEINDSNTVVSIEDHNMPGNPLLLNNQFQWEPDYNSSGTYQATFVATDGQIEDYETITITVNETVKSIDSNEDGNIDFHDFANLSQHWNSTEPDYIADLNYDGVVDYMDLYLTSKYWCR